MLGQYDGKFWKRPGRTRLETEEGIAGLQEAIAFLEKVQPLGPLAFSEGLALAARDHVRDQGPTGGTLHVGSRGQTTKQRIYGRGVPQGTFGEVINYSVEVPRMTVLQLIIDDGVLDRGHRRLIFNPAFKVAGAAIGPHTLYGSMTVAELAEGFVEGVDPELLALAMAPAAPHASGPPTPAGEAPAKDAQVRP